jgi:hypothetical protein
VPWMGTEGISQAGIAKFMDRGSVA